MIALGWLLGAVLLAAPSAPFAPTNAATSTATSAATSAAASAARLDEATLVHHIAGGVRGPSRRALEAALEAYAEASRQGWVAHERVLTLIDYTRPSSEPRLWVIDLVERRVLYHELVAHGRFSGDDRTTRFSNTPGSLMTSLGLFVTDQPYIGRNGYSLRLHGRTPGINDNAYERAIVVHGAPYVNEGTVARLGRLGRSWGCPAVPAAVARGLIDVIKGGSVLFAYGGDASDQRLTN